MITCLIESPHPLILRLRLYKEFPTYMWSVLILFQVVLLVLEVHACIAEDPQHFRQLVVFLVHNFQLDHSLLEK